ncbi:MAG: M20/M25/M40 family metallo-hydrolase [Ignavibacteriales bacterium]|nr:MAG: M20/M25/M40 family metallo-hydrolase [Ignavibacteriaceae bacterium]MBW7872984.1 M20/M25/M40 family metallo-hydrolase [Ignavibacteria bacterium]MCZ2142387.1 M20/M25/M40 family metallo-hydrolase [Ignavibacteriales bacterium]OQY79838.1 MAG: hypothetical protein B6D45_00265 [Ignavibacteriales bacterium UTCHB3]MBV6445270.1 hypothetical protein [Ignavibacteriaceae bacterium]
MSLRRYITMIAVVVLLAPFTLFPQATLPNILNQMNQDSLLKFASQITGGEQVTIGGQPYTIVSRYKTNPSNDMAGNFIQETLARFGLTASQQSFSSSGKNVIGVKVGTEFPNQKYMICAHYDCMPSGSVAPGADDNGSGTAAVLEAARVLSQYNFPYTLIFALWDEEEQGLIGSDYYARQARLAGDSILGVINMDMIAWDSNNDNVCNIHVKESVANSIKLYNRMIELNGSYGIGLVINRPNPPITASDHASFWTQGYSAVCFIEDDNNDFNAYYHTVNDKMIYYNTPYYFKMAKLATISIASFALNMDIVITHSAVQSAYRPGSFSTTATISTGLDVGTGNAAPRMYYRVAEPGGSFGQFIALTGTLTNGTGIPGEGDTKPTEGSFTYSFAFPALPSGATVQYYFAAQDNGGNLVVTSPTGGGGINPPGSTPPTTFYRFYNAESNLIFSDNGSSIAGWVPTGTWGLTTSKYVSAPSAFADSPTGNYSPNQNITLTQASAVNLSGAVGAGLSYRAQWDLETGWDYAQLLISTNGGSSWAPLRASGMVNGAGSFQPSGQPVYNGSQPTWQKEVVDLSEYIGKDILLRFLLKSDGSVQKDGIYIDDIEIFKYSEIPVELGSFSGTTVGNKVVLQWQTVTETNNFGFIVEKQTGSEFINLGFVNGNGTTTEAKHYSFTDEKPLADRLTGDYIGVQPGEENGTKFNRRPGANIVTYRLKQQDFDGTVVVLGTVEVEVSSVFAYSLSQNYPNPFNPETVIEFTVAEPGEVVLELYDIRGTKLRTLVSERKNQGNYSVTVTGEGLASGVYLVRMQAGKFTATKKITLLK